MEEKRFTEDIEIQKTAGGAMLTEAEIRELMESGLLDALLAKAGTSETLAEAGKGNPAETIAETGDVDSAKVETGTDYAAATEGDPMLTEAEIRELMESGMLDALLAKAEVEGDTATEVPGDEAATESGTDDKMSAVQDADNMIAKAEANDDATAEGAQVAPQKRKRVRKKRTAGSIFLIAGEILILCLAVSVFLRSVSLNSNDKITYADPSEIDTITCVDHVLRVNNVSVTVPDGNVFYDISYSWGKDDTDYPTVPRSATASYRDDSGRTLYDISLYRDSTTPAAEVPHGKNAQNWFDDWQTPDSEASVYEAKDSGKIHGFLIITKDPAKEDADNNGIGSGDGSGTGTGAGDNSGADNNEAAESGETSKSSGDADGSESAESDSAGDDEDSSTYQTSSYYFAVDSDDGISIYILEGILYDTNSTEAFEKAFNECITKIKVKGHGKSV